MKHLICRWLLAWLIAACTAATLSAQVASERVNINKIQIRHVGPPAVSDELIRANIRIKEGDSYSKPNIDVDVRNLYSTGYFYNIRVGEEITRDGLVLTYVVQGKPTLTAIKFQGNKKYSNAKLLKKVTSKIGEPLNEAKLFNDSQEILKLYQKAGYQKTLVKAAPPVIDENAGRGTVTFEITESPKVKILRVDFEGAQAFKLKKLRKVIKTRRRWSFSWLTGTGKLKDDEFEEDKEKLGDFYRNEGYIDFELKDVQFEYPEPNWMIIKLIISEGKQYKVGSVDFKGNTLFSSTNFYRGFSALGRTKKVEMGPGKTFTPKGLSGDLQTLEDFYGAKGYIDARVDARKDANITNGTMDLNYQIQEGDKSFIEKIEIKGNTKTKDKVIRRELAVAPGEVFNMLRVDLSTNRLAGLNYFEKIEARPEETDIRNRKNLVIAVDEKNTGNFIVGAGFSTIENVVGFVEVSQGNFDLFNPPYFTGGGQKIRLRTQVGTQKQDYQITFIEPWLFGRKLALSVDLFHRDLSYLSSLYDERDTGARLGLTRTLGFENLIGGVSYTIENIGIRNVSTSASPELQAEAGNRLVSKFGTTLAYDTRNSSLMATRGQRTELLAEVAGGPLGGDTDIYRLELRHSRYVRGFAPGHIWEILGRVGVVDKYGDTTRVPLFDRYFLGGQNTLRGYDFRKVGPRDSLGEPIGGDTYWFGSIEYSIPIIERLRLAAFYDVGMVYRDPYSFSSKGEGTGSFSDNWGIGIRLNLPIGPLRLDYGIPIHRDIRNSSSGHFQFGVGTQREF
ncbi:MAG: outer membrane protein assembly factor BamA [Verrucomicrobia bacterium]|nr:outer membrane protein assembly factor BamA [Verrucomicrobiota bacterium]